MWGHDVLVVTKPHGSSPPLAESIPPSTGKLFDLLGVRHLFDTAGFVRSTGNTVWWGGEETRVEPFAQAQWGWQVTTDRVAALLQRAALDAGARIEYRYITAGTALASGAAFVLDCSGRAGVVARANGWRVHEPSHQTIALAVCWQGPDAVSLPDPTQTLIESYPGGWAWSVPTGRRERHVAVMVDPRTSGLARGVASRDVYEAELRKAPRLAALVSRATPVGRPTGWDASMYSSTEVVGQNVLLVGDAGSFIDPVSSAGVKKALASGWLAAVATHTSLVRPEMRASALAFFAAREKDIYDAFRAMTARVLADAAAGHRHPFWSDRAEPAAAGEDQGAREAFERIRAADAIFLGRPANVSVEPRPAVSATEIVLEDRLVSPACPAGIRYLHDVDLILLTTLAPEHQRVPDLYDDYCRRAAPVAVTDFLRALAAAVAQGWLAWVDGDGTS
jgi:hypothetical protein